MLAQVTTIKDASFGLGKNPRKDTAALAAVIAKVRARHFKEPVTGTSTAITTDSLQQQFGQYQRLIPKQKQGESLMLVLLKDNTVQSSCLLHEVLSVVGTAQGCSGIIQHFVPLSSI